MPVIHSMMGKSNTVPQFSRTEKGAFVVEKQILMPLYPSTMSPSSPELLVAHVWNCNSHWSTREERPPVWSKTWCASMVCGNAGSWSKPSPRNSKGKTSGGLVDGPWYIYECDYDMSACKSRQQTWSLKFCSSNVFLGNPADRDGRGHRLLLLEHNQWQSLKGPLFHREMFQRYESPPSSSHRHGSSPRIAITDSEAVGMMHWVI